jgi:hypothetical protein
MNERIPRNFKEPRLGDYTGPWVVKSPKEKKKSYYL